MLHSISSTVIVMLASGSRCAEEVAAVLSHTPGVEILTVNGEWYEREKENHPLVVLEPLPPLNFVIEKRMHEADAEVCAELKTTAYQRSHPNQPWYAKYRKRERRR